MNTSQGYWIPGGLPEGKQVALSIPGAPPKTRREHRNRLEGLLVKLAEEVDEDVGPGAAAEEAYSVIPEQLLYLDRPSAHETVTILLQSDLMPSLFLPEGSLGPGVEDPELQERCQESGFQDRLVGLGLE
jgi:hypothetical protein